MEAVTKLCTVLVATSLLFLVVGCSDRENPVSPQGPAFAVDPTSGTDGVMEGSGSGSFIGTPVPLTEAFRTEVNGDYVAAGVSMRGTGSGNIEISLPAGSQIERAFLYWSVMRSSFTNALATGTFNATPITGTLIGTTGDPCWSRTAIHNFKADVTAFAVAGTNTLSDFATSATVAGSLLEGASLVVVYRNSGEPFREIVFREGAVSFTLPPPVGTTFTSFTAAGTGTKTTFIVADGQRNVPGLNSRIFIDGTEIANHILNGADPPPGSQFWDTETRNISSFVPSGDTDVTVAIESSSDDGFFFDCLTWVAQVVSVISPLTFDWPMDQPITIAQDFNCFSCLLARPDWFHTGIDHCPSSGCDVGPAVKAAANGQVLLIVTTTDRQNTWCDGTVDDLTRLSETANRGFGNAVVIRHASDLYSLYGHLDCIDKSLGQRFVAFLDDRDNIVSIARGSLLGKMGHSSQANRTDATFAPHVHFETKKVTMPGDPDLLLGRERECSRGRRGCVGYTPDLPADRPEYAGSGGDAQPSAVEYVDPMLLIHPPEDENAVALDVIGPSGVFLRPGPLYEIPFNELPRDARIVAFRRTLRDAQDWYQVHLAVPVGVTNAPTLNDGIEGWVAASLVEPVGALLVQATADDVEILAGPRGRVSNPASGRNSRPPPRRIARAWQGQVFIVVALDEREGSCEIPPDPGPPEIKTWYQIFVGNLRLSTGAVQKGWVCEDFVRIFP